MDVFWRLEVPIKKHYSALITFFRHLFRKAPSPDLTPYLIV